MHFAAINGTVESLQHLIDKYNIPLDSRTNVCFLCCSEYYIIYNVMYCLIQDGFHALHFAAMSGESDAVKVLLEEYQADPTLASYVCHSCLKYYTYCL